MTKWEVALEYGPDSGAPRPGYNYCVVERSYGRSTKTIATGLSAEEAQAVANARETLEALGDLWEGVHREDGKYFNSDKIRPELTTAFDVLMRAKGVTA